MPTNVLQFNLSIAKVGNQHLAARHLEHQKKIIRRVLRGVVFKTPVRTGRLRKNWRVSFTGTLAPGVTRARSGERGSKSAINALVFARAEAVFARRTVRPFSNAILYNNVFYAVFVEEGTETQTGRHMVQRTLSELRGVL